MNAQHGTKVWKAVEKAVKRSAFSEATWILEEAYIVQTGVSCV